MLSRSVVIKVSNEVSVLLVMFVIVLFVPPVPHVVLWGGMIVFPFFVCHKDRAETGVGGGRVKASNVTGIGGMDSIGGRAIEVSTREGSECASAIVMVMMVLFSSEVVRTVSSSGWVRIESVGGD